MLPQSIDQLWQASGVANLCRNGCAIKIGAESYAVDAQARNQVIKVAHQYLQRHIGVASGVLPQIVDAEVDADQAARCFDGVQLLIGQVARALAKRDRKSTRLNSSHVKISY